MADQDVVMAEANPEVTQEGEQNKKRKRGQPATKKIKPYHRIKAHRNPLSDGNYDVPVNPASADWSKHYPEIFQELPSDATKPVVTIADVGCGYVGLSKLFPDNLILGMEIRTKVVEYVQQRIGELREKNAAAKEYRNISVIETNAMKYLPNFFAKGQLEKIFFLYPDPHFRKSNYRRRIINTALLAEYAYCIKVGGLCYNVTDVKDLYDWTVAHFEAFPLFKRLTDAELEGDPVVPLVLSGTEEGRKVDRIAGAKYLAVYRRVDPEASPSSS